jgi:hypothetical protein
VQIHAFAVMSNHWQVLASASCGNQFASFMGYVNSNIAREMGRLYQWAGPFWGRRARPIPCLDDDSTIDRLRYCIAQGTKEGLVESPLMWPGASSTSALIGDMIIRGEWVDRDRLRPALRAASKHHKAARELEAEHTHEISFSLTPLPCWATLESAALREKHQELIQDVVAATKEARGSLPILGVAAVLSKNPHDAPQESANAPAPICHTTSQPIRERFRRAYTAFVETYRAACKVVRERFCNMSMGGEIADIDADTVRHSHAPPGCYLTAVRFVPQLPSILSSIVRHPDG